MVPCSMRLMEHVTVVTGFSDMELLSRTPDFVKQELCMRMLLKCCLSATQALAGSFDADSGQDQDPSNETIVDPPKANQHD